MMLLELFDALLILFQLKLKKLVFGCFHFIQVLEPFLQQLFVLKTYLGILIFCVLLLELQKEIKIGVILLKLVMIVPSQTS